jgi:hypothetical protein
VRVYRPLFLVVTLAGMVLALSLELHPGIPHARVSFFFWDYWLDTLKHFAGFMLIGFAYHLGVTGRLRATFVEYARTVWPVALFGIAAELLQIWVPNRTCNFFDLLANAVGPFAGYLILRAFSRWE